MLFSLAVAATVLASPPPLEMASQLPKGAVFLVIDSGDAPAVAGLRRPSALAESPPEAFLGGLLGQLAVVKPHRSGRDAAPSLQLFVLLAPMGDRLGFRAFGSF